MKTRILILSMLLLTGVATGFAQSGKCGENLTWTLDNGTLTIGGTGAMEDYFFDNLPPWLSYYSSITTVEIGDGVTSIGDMAFFECSRLTSITIPDGVTSIGWMAFQGCSRLTSITIPDGVKSIEVQAFGSCTQLTSFTNLNPKPQSIRKKSGSVFSNVKLEKATLYVPAEAIAAYKKAAVWKDFGTIKACAP